MTRSLNLLDLERRILTSDRGGILARWRYGRRLLADRRLCTPRGHLRHGVAEGLVRSARVAGLTLSERELQRRLKAARTYPTEPEIRRLLADFATWDALSGAGFPPAPEGSDDDRAPGLVPVGGPSPNPAWEQPSLSDDLFPAILPVGRTRRPLSGVTLAELRQYANEMASMTRRFAQRDQDRAARLAELLDAVDGDESRTYMEALAALGRQRAS